MKKNDNFIYSKEWKVLLELANGQVISDDNPIQNTATLNKKVNWLLYNGGAGVFAMIYEIFGKEELDRFYKFITYFIVRSDIPGHYYHSYQIKKDIENIRDQTQDVIFKDYIANLKKELILKDKAEKGEDYEN